VRERYILHPQGIPMSTILERLRAALAPHGILVDRELASGGMGTVFLATDQGLERALAVKILRPELASAAGVERFQREARLLANLTHPHIVPIHSTGFADGIPYYTMDLLSGETLADRLRHGPIPATEVVRVGRDVLAALAAAHRRDVVHRDVKPSNIFLVNGRGVLTDFGVAKRLTETGTALTEPGRGPGTTDYMPPEQLAGAEVTPRSDLYALGMVLYEAASGRKWELAERPERADWTGVPATLRPALRHALAWSPEHRWPSAEAFARALESKGWRPGLRAALSAIALMTIAGLIWWKEWPVWRSPAADLRIEALDVQDAGAARPLGDSLTLLLAQRLRNFPDFSVVGPGAPGRARRTVTGALTVRGAEARVTLRLGGQELTTVPFVPSRLSEAADELADKLLAAVFRGRALDPGLPVHVLPRAPHGFMAFLEAEKLLAAGHWAEADTAYGRAIEVDSSCWLCVWRQAEAARWVGMAYDTAKQHFLLDHIGQFPPQYQTMIRVDTLPTLARLDTLDALTRRNRNFPLGWFRYADEMMHRAPLVGRNERGAADAPLRVTLRLRGDFVPALEHLAWLKVAEGDSAGAAALLDSLELLPPERRSPMGIEELVRIAWMWRVLPPATARRRTEEALAAVRTQGVRDAEDAGARYLNAFDAPHGAIFLGRVVEPTFRYSGRIAQVIGWLELGRYDSATAVLRRERHDAPTPGLELFQAELRAVTLMFPVAGDAVSEAAMMDAAATLRMLAADAGYPPRLRARGAWMSGLLPCSPGHRGRGAGLVPLPPGSQPASLRQLESACVAAAHGSLDRALDVSQPLTELTAGHVEDPFFRTVLHLLRSDWWSRIGHPERAIRELYWYQNSDQDNLPTLDPQPMEIDWAFGVLARWRWASLLQEANGSVDDRCRLYGAVARLWAGGEPGYAARADTAHLRLTALGCAEHGG
jgi:hypothetical protein